MKAKQSKGGLSAWFRSIKNNRKLRLGTSATVFTAIVAAAVVLFNVIVGLVYDRFPLALDLTADNTFTLSDESREVASNIDREVEILVFMEESVFSAPATGYEELDTVLRQFYMFTQDYQSLSKGNVSIKYLDMEANPTLATTYKQYEAQSGDILFRSGEQYRKISVDDLYTENSDGYSYTYSSLVEQKLASSVNAVFGGNVVTLTFLTGHGENEDLISIMKELYELNGYVTQSVNLSSATEIDETTGALIIAGPTSDFSAEEITRLRTWLNNDGKLNRHLYVLADHLGSCPNLYEFLSADYGITVTNNLIMETDTDNFLSIYTDGKYAPVTTVSGSDLTEVLDGKDIVMPYTLQLLTEYDTDTSNSLTNFSLVTFPESAELIDQSTLTEDSEPTSVKADSYPIIGVAYAQEIKQTSDHKGVTNVFVSGSYMFPGYSSLEQYANEGLLMQPMLNMCSLGDTVVISSTSLSSITLSYSATEASVIEWIMILIPISLMIVCLVVFLKRRHL